jgi:hypothetical protein
MFAEKIMTLAFKKTNHLYQKIGRNRRKRSTALRNMKRFDFVKQLESISFDAAMPPPTIKKTLGKPNIELSFLRCGV